MMRPSSSEKSAGRRLRQRLQRVAGALPLTAALAATAALLPATFTVPANAAGRSVAHVHVGLVATIRRTTGGVPHILAHNWTSLGFGYGFAFAQDNLCTMANDYVTVNAQRSRYFGPNSTYTQGGNGVTSTDLDSDLFFKQIIDSGLIGQITKGMDPRLGQVLSGYVQGYNHYLASVGGAKGVPDPTCRGRAWVKPITLLDAELRFYQLMLLSGEGTSIDAIAQAAPPKAGARVAPSLALTNPRRAARLIVDRLRASHDAAGSNAVAIGSAGTTNHHGLLLGNPHFPWMGTERFYQAQLTLPGQINVTGASLYGVPLILIGHNADVAWSHTVSTAFRFTPYQLTLVPKHPTEYKVNGHPVAMTASRVTVTIRKPNGKLVPYSRTLYSTRYGPVVNSLAGIALAWTRSTAFAMRDANATNLARAMNTWFGMDRADTTGQLLSVIEKYQGIPWVNTVAADKQGEVLYADIGSIPGVPNTLAHRCDTGLGVLTFAEAGLPILDGSKTSCDWITGPHAAAPGLLGPDQEPSLLRTDFVTNSNDSFWLANPHHPLTGFARIIGTVKTARTLRTRIGLLEVQARIDGTDGLGPPGFTLSAMEHLDLSDLDYAATLTKKSLVTMCRRFHGSAPTTGGGTVKVGNACTVLADWNMHWDLDQRGAELFGAFWNDASFAQPSPFSHKFQVSKPVTTPFGLNTGNPTVRTALGDAIRQLNQEHMPIDATLGSVQYVSYQGKHIPIPGGPGDPDGIYNAIYTGPGPAPNSGSSFIQVVTWNNSSCPDGQTILTYSESSNPTSPHFADQTMLFSHKQFLPDLFCQSQIMSDPHLQVTTVRS
jgi:acyl-homoserine-lactone acylase